MTFFLDFAQGGFKRFRAALRKHLFFDEQSGRRSTSTLWQHPRDAIQNQKNMLALPAAESSGKRPVVSVTLW